MSHISYRKLFYGCVGFFAGIVAALILLVAAPFFFAWFLYNESDED